MEELREKIARAIVDRRELPTDAEVNWDAFRADAAAALRALGDEA